MGTNYLVRTDPERILSVADDILDGRAKEGKDPALVGWEGGREDRGDPLTGDYRVTQALDPIVETTVR